MSADSLHINDLFWTLQGEGHFSGRRSLFIRLPYCNYDCPWCDTEYDSYELWSEENFIEFINQETSRFAVITGGEPLVHKHLPRIINILKDNNFYIACETNGSAVIPDEIDFATTSPKTFTKGKHPSYYVDPKNFERTSEWKYVVDEGFDFKVLKRHEPFLENCYYSLSPEFSQMKKNTERIMDFIKENPHWRLSLQTHKWINIP